MPDSGNDRAGGRSRKFRRRGSSRFTLEALESRQLLTRAYPIPLGPPPNVRNVVYDRTFYTMRLEGPGVIRTRGSGSDGIDVTLLGTTQESVLTVTRRPTSPLLRSLGINSNFQNPHGTGDALPVKRLEVRTGRLGGIDAPEWLDLVGPVSPLDGSVEVIRVNAIGPNARLDIAGDLGTLQADVVLLGQGGAVDVGGNVAGEVLVRDFAIDGGQFLVGQDLGGPAGFETFRIDNGGLFFVGRDVLSEFVVRQDAQFTGGGTLSVGNDVRGPIAVGGRLSATQGGRLVVGQNLARLEVGQALEVGAGEVRVGNDLRSLLVAQDLLVSQAGLLEVGRDLTGRLAVGGDLSIDAARFLVGRDLTAATLIGGSTLITNVGLWGIGRDVTQTIRIEGDLVITPGSELFVGRDLAGISVGGSIDTSEEGGVRVGGELIDLP